LKEEINFTENYDNNLLKRLYKLLDYQVTILTKLVEVQKYLQ